MAEDRELAAMGKVLDAIEKLSPEEKSRVLSWVAQKFAVELKVSTGKRPADDGAAGGGGHSTDTIATALDAKSGADIVIAAAAHLHFARGKQKFTRQELTAEMRAAPAHFKESYVNNLSAYLAGLTKADRLRLVSADTYAISSKERQSLEKVLEQL